MTINGAGIIALGTYIGWRFMNFYEQASSGNASKLTIATDMFYMIVMSYLLVTGSKLFAAILMLNAAANACLGAVVSMSPWPKDVLENVNRTVSSLWLYTLIDIALGGAAYVIMVMWGLV